MRKGNDNYIKLLSMSKKDQKRWILELIEKNDENRSSVARFFNLPKSTFFDRLAALKIEKKFNSTENYKQGVYKYNIGEAYCVYVLKNSSYPGMYKIGKTKNLKKRLTSLNCASPSPFEIVKVVRCFDEKQSLRIEHKLHKRFRNNQCRSGREFFNLTNKEIVEIGRCI